MLKILIFAVGILGVAFIAFIIWFARNPIVFTAPIKTRLTVQASRDDGGQAIRCVLRFSGSDKPHVVTEIKLSREWAQALGASPPSGFVEQPLVAGTQTDDQEFIAKFNRETVRWVGQLAVPLEQDVILAIPAQRPQAGNGTIRFQFEHRGTLGGSIQFAQATL